MRSFFTNDFFAGNRRRLRELTKTDAPIVITANGLIQAGGDVSMPFHQDSSFWYLTGIDEPDIVLVMADEDYLIVPNRDEIAVAFDGALVDDVLSNRSGVKLILDEKAGWQRLAAELKRAKKVATPSAGPARLERFSMYANPARAMLEQKMRELAGELEITDIREQLMRLRAVKQAPELAALQQSIDITIDGIKYVTEPGRLPAYKVEYEIEADLTREFRRRGASGHGFEPTISSGKRSCTLHSHSNDGTLKAGDLLQLDVGAEVEQYDADISRVVAPNGKPTKRQQQVFDAVCAVQDFALSLLKPGLINVEYEQQVEAFMGEKLRELGVIKNAERADIRKYFPHATSHFLGLDTHDVGDYRSPLEPDMVLTCEPGIYIPEEGIGIRIEDDVLITPDGNKVMSAALPRALH